MPVSSPVVFSELAEQMRRQINVALESYIVFFGSLSRGAFRGLPVQFAWFGQASAADAWYCWQPKLAVLVRGQPCPPHVPWK